MQNLLSIVLDFIFPPSKETLALRVLSPEKALHAFTAAPPTPFPFITALFSYKDPLVTELVLSIKNKKDHHAFHIAGFSLFQHLESLGLREAVLVSIPISAKRRRERGYNQCELLIDAILTHDTGHLFKRIDILKRTRHTTDQKTKNRSERLLGSTGIFEVTIAPLPTPIIIIDDVVTTGVTLREARDTLLKAGFQTVLALTLAH